MLIYLDANIVQYCADYGDQIFRNEEASPSLGRKLRRELDALRQLVYLEQFGNWTFASNSHLQCELHRGRPTKQQREVYSVLKDAGDRSCSLDEQVYQDVLADCLVQRIRDRSDQKHIATAAAMGASWFLTNDGDVVRKLKETPIGRMRVTKPSECLSEISIGLFLH
jgi:hypothetical protein